MRKKITAFTLAFLSALLLMCPGIPAASAASGDYIAANHTRSNGNPYYIMVNRAQSTVTVYGLDGSGYYTVPVKAMICSTGRTGHATPLGTYTVGTKRVWVHMVDGSYGQYCTQITGSILFHSVCYTKMDPSTLMTAEYNGLGAPASLGCVRLQTMDAKWIYDNCAPGTKITVYDGASPGPLGKPEKVVGYITEEMDNGWDPTDPREENPWRGILPSSAQMPGTETVSEAERVPSAQMPKAETVPEAERVSYAQTAQALYELSGGTKLTLASEFTTWAVQNRLLDNMVERTFDPFAPITRQDLITMLYRYETGYLQRTAQGSGSLAQFADQAAVEAYAVPAMRWAVGGGLIQGTSENTLHPASFASKTQLEVILQRYEQLR